MEILSILLIFFLVWLIFKILGVIFYTGAFLITLPFKILFSILVLLICIPFGILSILVGVIGIIIPLLPFILVAAGLFLFLRNS